MAASEQYTLDGQQPAKHHPNNLPKSLIDHNGIVITHVWLRYCATGEAIGDCRKCGGPIHALRPTGVNTHRTDYEAECRNLDCRAEVVFPNGRTGRWDDNQQRGRKRKLPAGQTAIARDAKGQSGEVDD